MRKRPYDPPHSTPPTTVTKLQNHPGPLPQPENQLNLDFTSDSRQQWRAPPLKNKKLIQTIALCLGALTTLYTAIWALTQNDIKKIIAFSTSSQLGLIMVTISINQPYLAFLHICTHALFKAILFICSGSIIHSFNNE
eukprot:bmy_21203T0